MAMLGRQLASVAAEIGIALPTAQSAAANEVGSAAKAPAPASASSLGSSTSKKPRLDVDTAVSPAAAAGGDGAVPAQSPASSVGSIVCLGSSKPNTAKAAGGSDAGKHEEVVIDLTMTSDNDGE